MGLFLDKPKREKTVESGEGNDLRFAVSAMQGWRVDMEDSHSMKTNLAPNLEGSSYFAVFDGHAGDFVSKFAAEHLWEEIHRHLEGNDSSVIREETDPKNANATRTTPLSPQSTPIEGSGTSKSSDAQQSKLVEETKSASEKEEGSDESDEKYDRNLNDSERPCLSKDLDHFKASIRQGFFAIDEKLKELPRFVSGEERSGSTAIVVIVTKTHVVFANCGDSRALLSRNGGEIAFATQDHKPYNESEKLRIEKAGGSVIIQRVNGSLAVSRALGDFDYKRVENLPCTEQLVSAEPEMMCIERNADDEFLVLACDGIWDVMSNQEVVNFVRHRMSVHEDLTQLCGELLETCLAKGSKDNMSVIIVAFPGAPKVSQQAIQEDAEVDKVLKEKIEDYIKKCSEPKEIDTSVIVDFLQEQELSNLPPGGGLQAKMNVIEDILDELIPDRMKDEGPHLGNSIPVPLNMIRQFAGGMIDDDAMPSNDAEDRK